MTTERPYNAHFDIAPTGHVAVARSCGDGWWEDWVYACDRQWRPLAELEPYGRAHLVADTRREPSVTRSRGRSSTGWLLLVVNFVALGGCAATPVVPQPAASLPRWQILDLLERERSIAVVREPTAPLHVPSHSVGEDVMHIGGAVAQSGSAGGILGLGLVAAAIPVAIAEGAIASRRETRVEAFLVDPIPALERHLVSALRAEPALGGVEWRTEASACGTSCDSALSLRLRSTERVVCADRHWITYGATARVVRTQGGELLWQGECLRVDRDAFAESSRAFSSDQRVESFAKELQSKFDALAAECGAQLVTSLLGRGAAVSDEHPPYCK